MISPWPTLDSWLIPAFFLGFGTLFLLLAWALLAEYREAFMANPRAVMSFEVLAQILQTGAPGYIAAFGLTVGLAFFGIGAFILVLFVVAPLFELLRQLIQVISLNFQ
jgi:hypothetical protein